MSRARPDPFAYTTKQRYLVLWDLNWQIIECRSLDSATDLRSTLSTAINKLQRDGWYPEGTTDFGFLFLTRGLERRLLMVTARNPHERSSQSFNPLQR